MSEVTVIQLREALIQYFNITELRTLCMELGQDYESFGGSGKDGKALEIATWSQRHGRLDELAGIVKRERPHAFQNVNVPAAKPNPQQPQGGSNVYNIYGNVVGGVVGDGSVKAGNIAGGDITIDNRNYKAGRDMYVAGGNINIHAPETKDEFKVQLAELRQLIEEAKAAGDFSDEHDAIDALSDLRRADKEINQPQPDVNDIETKLKDAKKTLEAAAETAKSAGKTAVALAKAAALSGVLFDTVTKLFS